MAATLLHGLSAVAGTYYVNSIAGLQSRINAAVAGDTIIVSNGIYSTSANVSVNRAGTAANPIVIKAETVGDAEITGAEGFNVSSPATHIQIEGFRFTHGADGNYINNGATFIRFTRNIFECTGDGNYLLVAGYDSEVDHNEFRNKSTVGNMIDVRGSGCQIARRVWIHHNYFHDFANAGANGAETIRFGLSGLSLSTGDGLIEYNLFVHCTGENEMISNKSSGNTYRYNTVLDSPGAEISQRHGNDCLYYGNYMRNTQGMRVYGDRHKFFSNYFENNAIGINMGNGDGDVYNGAALTAHDRPDDNVVAYNTFINNSTHYQMGGRSGGLGSSNTVVANNIFQGGGNMASISGSAPYTGSWSNNIRWQTSSAGNMPASGYLTVNPLLAKDASGAYHLQSGSVAINFGKGASDYYGVHSTFPFVTEDMDGQARDGNKDVGADEVSDLPVTAHILTTKKVGPHALESAFSLKAVPTFQLVPPGVATNVSYAVDVTDLFGSNATVTLNVSGLPEGTSAEFTPPFVIGSGSSSFSLTVSNSVANGVYPLIIIGTSPVGTNTTTVHFVISDDGDVRPDALVARYTFDDGTASDWSGNGNHGTLAGTAAIVDDPERGKVLSLDGAGGKVDLGNPASMNIVGECTVTAWVRLNSGIVGNHGILQRGHQSNPSREFVLRVGSSGTAYEFGTWSPNQHAAYSIPSEDIGQGDWVHLAGTMTSSGTDFTYRLYRNGTEVASFVGGDGLQSDYTVGWAIGARGGVSGFERVFDGLIDDVRLYKVALSQAEIQTIMNPPAPLIVSMLSWDGANLRLNWTGGIPPYRVQTKTNIGNPTWQDFGASTSNNSLAITPEAPGGFFRVQSQ